MADCREPSLESQAATAILNHEQADPRPTGDQLRRIVEFETQLCAAQGTDVRGGLLDEQGGPIIVGPGNLARGKAGGLARPADQMTLMFDPWRQPGGAPDLGLQLEVRASVARQRRILCPPVSTSRRDVHLCNVSRRGHHAMDGHRHDNRRNGR